MRQKISQSAQLLRLAARVQLWHTPDGEAYATFETNGHREHWPVRSMAFRSWLQHLYYRRTRGSAHQQALQDALGALEGRARYDGAEYSVHVRVAENGDSVFVDLANRDWQAVEVNAAGWRIVADPPVRFRRAKAMLALPTPERDGSVFELRRFVNVSDSDWPLVLGWLIAALYPRGPYPLLSFSAEQGSGKSTAARVLRSLVDPNSAPLRCEPREPRDLMIAANNGRVVALDNVSTLPVWLSDALCRLSTGGGFATRELYTDQGEVVFDSQRPVLVTGIEDVIGRGDLLDRSMIVNLPTIPQGHRRAESEFWREFEAARPRMFGALLTALSTALRALPNTTLSAPPRMADFALLATAAEPGLGLERGSFMAAYGINHDETNALALEGSPVAKFVINLASEGTWEGTASDLLEEVDRLANDVTRRQRSWPTSAKALSGALKRLAPNLRRAGVEVEFKKEPTGRRRKLIAIRTAGNSSGTVRPIGTNQRLDVPHRTADFPRHSVGVNGHERDAINKMLSEAAEIDSA